MNQAVNWIERFGISDEDLAHLVAESGEENPLRWCLLNDRISEAEYVQWAMEAYQMPSVGREFFTSPVDTAFWERVKGLNKWTTDLYPLADWEGVLLIACVEPPTDFYFRLPHRFVLAGARSLALHWAKLNPKVAARVIEAPLIAPPPPTPIYEAPLSTFPEVDLSYGAQPAPEFTQFDDSAVDLSESGHPPLKVAANLDIPDGFSFDATVRNPTAPKSDFDLFEEKPAVPVSETEASIAERPDGFAETNIADFSFDFTGDLMAADVVPTAAPAVAPAEFAPAQKAPVPTPAPAAAPAWSAVYPAPAAPAPTPIPAPAAAPAWSAVYPAPAPAQTAPPPPPVRAQTPPPPPPVNLPERPPKMEAREESTSTITLAQMDIRTVDTCVSLDDLGAVAMVHTIRIFNGAMVLLYQGGELKPWKWSDLLTSDRHKNLKVELETPSIFKIVYKTRLPYHGYITPSPTNSMFFNAFHNGSLPAHVTLVPIVIEEEFVGMIMGISNVEISYKESLKQMERLSEDFGNRLAKLRTANAA